jgi:orotidine-5'-phosphate decarboxylase
MASTAFEDKLGRAWDRSGASLCVGLDPILERLPAQVAAADRPILTFNRYIVDLVGDLVCAFKPQAAHHAAYGAEQDLADTIAYIRQTQPHAVVILDAKRGDIGSTADMYAKEAFERYDADAVTVNPYMGDDTILPFLGRDDRAAVVLCRTSNPDAGRIQDVAAEGGPVFAAVARRAETVWSQHGNVMLVVGATSAAEDIAAVRRMAPSLTLLAPGIGEQGGSIDALMGAGARDDGRGLIPSASRSVLYAGAAEAIRAAAETLHRQLAWREAGAAATPCVAGVG